jgi:hypothetical protein
MGNELAVYQQFDAIKGAALALHESGFFSDVKSEAQAIVKVMAGAELGIPPFASMSGIHIVQGKPVLGSNVIATLVKNDPRYNYHIRQQTDEACILEWFEHGAPQGQSTFTIQEAQRAGLTSKNNWKTYPSDMLFARAISRGARRFAPGIFGGAPVYTPDEMGVDTDEDGYIVEVVEVKPEPQPEPEHEQPATFEHDGVTYFEKVKNICNSDGTPYYMLTTDQLSKRYNYYEKKTDRNEEEERKYRAAAHVLKARSA